MNIFLLLTLSLLLVRSSMAPPNDNPIPSFFFFFFKPTPPHNSVHFSIPVLSDQPENNITFTPFPSVLRFTDDAPAPSLHLMPDDPNCQYQTEIESTYLVGREIYVFVFGLLLRYQRVYVWFAPLIIWLLLMMIITRTPTNLVVQWKIIHKRDNVIGTLPLLIILSLFHLIPQNGLSQPTYVGGLATDCTNNAVFGTCHALLTFRAAAPYRTIRSISGLFKVDPSSVSMMSGRHSNISETTVLEVNRLVVVRGNCSNTTSNYYQMKVASNYVTHKGDTVYSIANQVYQGLTTCRAIYDHNPIIFNHTTGRDKDNISSGMEMVVPLRCGCPTKRQTEVGIKSLMTYIVEDGDTVARVSERFKVDQGLTLEANKLSKQHDDKNNPVTTLLVPFIQIRRRAMSDAKPAPSPSKPMNTSSGGGLILHIRRHQLIYSIIAAAALIFGGGFGVRVMIQNCECCNNIYFSRYP